MHIVSKEVTSNCTTMTLALRTPWTVWGIHRPPSSKIVDYEKDLIKVASFDSVS